MAHELAKIELATGNHAEIIAFLVDMIARDPLDESFVRQLMLAYYRCGRQADAIELHRTTARLLRHDADVAPSPTLQNLVQDIRRHAPSVAGPPRPPVEPTPGLDRLPPPLPDFTGRSAELAELSAGAATVDDVVVIEGMPSAGKTTPAIKAAHDLADRFPGGCFFLRLYGHDAQHPPESPARALATLLELAGVAPTSIPKQTADRVGLWHTEHACPAPCDFTYTRQ